MTTDDPTPSPVLFDFEAYLKSDELASIYNEQQKGKIIWYIMGTFSTIASISIIVHILRSHQGLSTTYHRLVVGLSLGDIIYTFFGHVLGTIMAPKELDYFLPGAVGNQATCDAVDFLGTFGLQLLLLYNNSICLYYLAIVTFNKTDDYIRKKLEPCFHGITILVPLAANMIVAFTGGGCTLTPTVMLQFPHCTGLEIGEIRDGFTIPCGREDGEENPTTRSSLFSSWIEYLITFTVLVTPVTIVVTMALMYRTVHKNDQKMQRYGAGSLRLRAKATDNPHIGNNKGNTSTNNNPSDSPPDPHDGKDSGIHTRFSLIQWSKNCLSKIPCTNNCCSSGHTARPRSNTVATQKRAILNRAFGYILAWGLSWIPMGVLWLGLGSGVGVEIVLTIFHPLQGVYNFIAYMLPKVRNAKQGPTRRNSRIRMQGGANQVTGISWRRAFVKACMSRGPNRTSGQHRARSNISNGSSWSNNISNAWKNLKIRASMTARKKSTRRSSSDKVESATEQQQQQQKQQQQEIHPPTKKFGQGENIVGIPDAPPPAQPDNDDQSPAAPSASLQMNSYASSPPLVLSGDADDLKGGECGDEVFLLNNSNDEDSEQMSSDLEGVLDDVYFSEEVQSILE